MERIGLGERTERLVAFEGWSLRTRLWYDVVCQPDRPDYHHGNLLVLARPPEHDELDHLQEVWRQELGSEPGIAKVVVSSETVEPDPPEGLAAAAAAAGLLLELDEILVLGTPVAVPPPDGVTIRPARDDEWKAITALGIDRTESAREKDLRRWQMRAYRRLVKRRVALWWVALRGEEVVGSAGLFSSSALARYQQVFVHPAHRRRGIATALVSAMACHHHGMWPHTMLVIVAERGSSPERIYRRLGFERHGSFVNLSGPVP